MTGEHGIDLLIRKVRDFMLRGAGGLWFRRVLGAFARLRNVVSFMLIFYTEKKT